METERDCEVRRLAGIIGKDLNITGEEHLGKVKKQEADMPQLAIPSSRSRHLAIPRPASYPS
jgi:hypothetical protein